MSRRKTFTITVTLAIAALTLAACGEGDGDGGGSSQPQGESLQLTLGTKNFTESILTGELYAQALRADGVQVTLRKDIGPTEDVDKALEDGDIDAYPEYLGVAATVVAGEDVAGKTSEETSKIARDFYTSRGQSVSDETPFENVDAIAVSTPFARDNSLRTIADLGELDSFTLGARPEFEDREQGFAGMQSVYGLPNAVFTPTDLDKTYDALFDGDVDAANVFSTDAQLESGDYRVLEDTERVFGYQHVALVIDDDTLAALGEDDFMKVIENVNKVLTQNTMIELNGAVDLQDQDPADVAEAFLREKNLLN